MPTPPIASTPWRFQAMCSTGSLRKLCPIGSEFAISPISARAAAGCIWQPYWISLRARLWAGPCLERCPQRWCVRLCRLEHHRICQVFAAANSDKNKNCVRSSFSSSCKSAPVCFRASTNSVLSRLLRSCGATPRPSFNSSLAFSSIGHVQAANARCCFEANRLAAASRSAASYLQRTLNR